MSVILNILKILLALVLVGLGIWFTGDNRELISLTVFGFVLPKMTLGLWVLGAFLLGSILGVAACFGGRLKTSATIRQQARQLDKHAKQIEAKDAQIEQLKAERSGG
jgi:hypothetical protein